MRIAKGLPMAKTPHEQESLQRQITATDKAIDAQVYEFYGVTEDEIRIVEGVCGELAQSQVAPALAEN